MCFKCEQALFSNMISLITEGYCSMILGVLHRRPAPERLRRPKQRRPLAGVGRNRATGLGEERG